MKWLPTAETCVDDFCYKVHSSVHKPASNVSSSASTQVCATNLPCPIRHHLLTLWLCAEFALALDVFNNQEQFASESAKLPAEPSASLYLRLLGSYIDFARKTGWK
jgi:hypothetical protein